MVKKEAIIKDLESNLPALKEAGIGGCTHSHVQWAMGFAILQALKMGYEITDLDWFKDTAYYTGDQHSQKIA